MTNLDNAISFFENDFESFWLIFVGKNKDKTFAYSDASLHKIHTAIFNKIEFELNPKTLIVQVERHSYPSTLAWFTSSFPYSIFLNEKKLNRSTESIAGSLAHEYIHLLDYHCSKYEFGHAKKRFWNKGNVGQSLPYVVGREFKSFMNCK